jgi:hypothetical protein
MDPEYIHIGLTAVGVLITVAVAFIGLQTKLAVSTMRDEQSKVKEELVASQNEMRNDMDAKHAENRQAIAVHTASDDRLFDSINKSLDRIEKKVDYRNGKTV